MREIEQSIFPFMDGISYSSYEQFLDTVTEERNQMLIPDKSLVLEEPVQVDLQTASKIPNGRFTTFFQGIRLECFAIVRKNRPLYVMLNGDVGEFSINGPVFNRWSYYKFCGGSILSIADPMLDMYPDLHLGWYYGNKEINFRKLLAEFVKIITDILQIGQKDIVFCGSSAGGAPVFECASYISGAKAVAINPQIVLEEYYYAEEFTRITGNNLWVEGEQSDHRCNALYYIKNHDKNPYIIIDNIRSQNDMRQIENIRNSLNIEVHYGLNVYDNLIMWLYDADVAPVFNPHSACENYCIWFWIEYLVNHINRDACKELGPIYRLVNEFWHEHWLTRKQQIESIRGCLEVLNRINELKSEVAVFGCGRKASHIWKNVLDVQGENHLHVSFGIDNDRSKMGEEIMGLKIKHPSEIREWQKIYIIITTDLYGEEVSRQLEKEGLIYKQDYILYKDLSL